MLPRTHILLGSIFSIILFLFFGVSLTNAFIVFLSSVFIDIDHYLFYVFRKKDFSLGHAYRWYMRLGDNHKPLMNFLHSIEFLVLVLIFSLFFPVFIFIFVGLIFHSILDVLEMTSKGILKTREFFFTRYLLRDRSNYF